MNTIQKSLVLGGMGAVIIILSYLIALLEIELSINIPAMVAPTSISEKRVVPESSVDQVVEETATSSPMITKIKNELLACTESVTATLIYVAPHPFIDPMKAEMTVNLEIKGLDDAGFCHVDQEMVKTTIFLLPEDRQAIMDEEGVTESDVEQMLSEINEGYIGMPTIISDCYGAPNNLLAYFQALEEGGGVGNVSTSFSSNDGSVNVMEDYQVTCVTPLVFVDAEEEESSSTEDIIVVPAD